MSKKTFEKFQKEVFQLVGNEYEILGEYIDTKTKLLMRHNCSSCNNYEWMIKPSHFLANVRCPKCRGGVAKSEQQFKQEVFDLVGTEYTVLGKYISTHKKILMRHNCEKCNNNIYEVEPNSFLSGSRCRKCNYIIRTKSDGDFRQEINCLMNGEYLTLDKYSGNRTKIRFQHISENCNNSIFLMTPDKFLHGRRCPICKESKGEKAIRKWLETNNFNFEPQYKFGDLFGVNGGTLRFDFAIFDNEKRLKGVIEFQGAQHYKVISFGRKNNQDALNDYIYRISNDNIKRHYCNKNNINLLEIPYYEIKNINNILKKAYT